MITVSWSLASAAEAPFCDETEQSVLDGSPEKVHFDHPLADANDHDPCHMGVCHFGHCVHIRLLTASLVSEKLAILPNKMQTPYVNHLTNGVIFHHERPPILKI